VSAVLEIRDLIVRFGANTILDGVSLSGMRSERIAILGPSGSGKTSLLRAINGFTPVVSGSVRVNGVDVTRSRGAALRRVRGQIGFISQRHDLIDGLAVHQNVMAGALGRWSAWRAGRFLVWPFEEELETAREALRDVGLEDKLRARTATLSGGQHQRVAIARALVQKPILLLADEPVASLDPKTSEQILELLSGLAKEKQVMLICSLHQPELAERYFDRIIQVSGGKLDEIVPASLSLGSAL
jgi:phosphonate transport system ATP-binding protein